MSFIDFARAHGIEIDPAKLLGSERIKRCGTINKPRSTNGAYYWNGRHGWVMAWDGDGEVHWWNDPNDKPWTEVEKAQWRQQRQRQQDDEKNRHERAAQKAAVMLRAAVPGPHDYLIRKGFPDAQGLVLPTWELVVPMRSVFKGDLKGLQSISWNAEDLKWEKKMLPGMQAKGAVHRIGPKLASETIFCEGFATGLSIEAAVRQMRLNAAVVICFSDNNVAHVAPLLTKGKRYVFADNDKSGAGERAAKATGLPYCMSPQVGEDANDLHVRAGLFAVCQLLMKTRLEATVP